MLTMEIRTHRPLAGNLAPQEIALAGRLGQLLRQLGVALLLRVQLPPQITDKSGGLLHLSIVVALQLSVRPRRPLQLTDRLLPAVCFLQAARLMF